MLYFNEFIIFVVSYLVGSVLFSIWIVRLFGLPDPRKIGSGNPGASNVMRECGKAVGITVLLGDVLKGLLPVWLVQQLGFPDWVVAGTGLATYLGHLFPVYHRFRGGKGVATFIGCLLGFNLLSAIGVIIIWGIAIVLSRYAALSSILISMIAPVLIGWSTQSLPLILATTLMGVATIIKHKDNIARLLAGEENKLK